MNLEKIALYKNENILFYSEFSSKNGNPILLQHGLIASIEDYDLFEGLIDLWTRLISIARPGYPVVIFLASDESRWITGQNINVDGGQPETIHV